MSISVPISCCICREFMGYQVEEGYPYGTFQNEFVCSDECAYTYEREKDKEEEGEDNYEL